MCSHNLTRSSVYVYITGFLPCVIRITIYAGEIDGVVEYAAIVSGGKGTAQDKIKTLREAGVTVVESPAKIGTAMLEVFKQRGLV